ncbi:MAG: hypothetical protein WCJ46_06365 [bacterium]
MKKNFLVLLAVVILMGFSVPIFCAEADDYISAGAVKKAETKDILEAGTVKKISIVIVEATGTFTPGVVATATQVAAVKPVIKPKTKPRVIPTATHIPTVAPTPTVTAMALPDFNIAEVTTEEVVKEKNSDNWFGLTDMLFSVKKLNVRVLMANKILGGAASNVTAELLSTDAGIKITNGKKDLQNILPGDTREMSFVIDITKEYKGPAKLPLMIKIKADTFDYDYTLDVQVKKQNWTLFIITGLLSLIVILLVVIAIKK